MTFGETTGGGTWLPFAGHRDKIFHEGEQFVNLKFRPHYVLQEIFREQGMFISGVLDITGSLASYIYKHIVISLIINRIILFVVIATAIHHDDIQRIPGCS